MGITHVTPPPDLVQAPPHQAASGRQRATTAGTDEKRDRILQVAQELFAAQGYAATTMAQIVETLGVTKPFVYYYFRNKQEIFEILSWQPTVACFTAMDFAPDDARPAHVQVAQGLERLIRATLAHYPASFFPYREPQAYRPEYRAAQKALAQHFYARLCTLLEAARAEGHFTLQETRIAAQAACSLPGFLYHWYRPEGRLPREAMVAELTGLALRMLGLPASVGTPTDPPAFT